MYTHTQNADLFRCVIAKHKHIITAQLTLTLLLGRHFSRMMKNMVNPFVGS